MLAKRDPGRTSQPSLGVGGRPIATAPFGVHARNRSGSAAASKSSFSLSLDIVLSEVVPSERFAASVDDLLVVAASGSLRLTSVTCLPN